MVKTFSQFINEAVKKDVYNEFYFKMTFVANKLGFEPHTAIKPDNQPEGKNLFGYYVKRVPFEYLRYKYIEVLSDKDLTINTKDSLELVECFNQLRDPNKKTNSCSYGFIIGDARTNSEYNPEEIDYDVPYNPKGNTMIKLIPDKLSNDEVLKNDELRTKLLRNYLYRNPDFKQFR